MIAKLLRAIAQRLEPYECPECADRERMLESYEHRLNNLALVDFIGRYSPESRKIERDIARANIKVVK